MIGRRIQYAYFECYYVDQPLTDLSGSPVVGIPLMWIHHQAHN